MDLILLTLKPLNSDFSASWQGVGVWTAITMETCYITTIMQPDHGFFCSLWVRTHYCSSKTRLILYCEAGNDYIQDTAPLYHHYETLCWGGWGVRGHRLLTGVVRGGDIRVSLIQTFRFMSSCVPHLVLYTENATLNTINFISTALKSVRML